MQISYLSKLFEMSKKWKHEFHAIFLYAKRIEIKYIHNFLTLKDPLY
jgi:archaellum biogenesis protein FlaJ (TadC family)